MTGRALTMLQKSSPMQIVRHCLPTPVNALQSA
jgi:hypothetical protein